MKNTILKIAAITLVFAAGLVTTEKPDWFGLVLLICGIITLSLMDNKSLNDKAK